MNNFKYIPLYIINLKSRADRKEHILKEFAGLNEFRVTIVDAFEHKKGAIGLWNSIAHILQNLLKEDDDFMIICEDDHQFTEHYSREHLVTCIGEAEKKGSDILSGGVSWHNSAVQAGNHIYWTEKFTGLQFTVIFRKFYSKILKADFGDTDAADFKICSLTDEKYFVYPFISTQKEFGYSDVTPKNNLSGRVCELFKKSESNVSTLNEVYRFYGKNRNQKVEIESTAGGVCITTYVVKSSSNSIESYSEANFSDKPEFSPAISETNIDDPSGNWRNFTVLKKIIANAFSDDEDVIIICDEQHQFSSCYSSKYLITNIIEAYEQGADILFGGGEDFGHVVPVSANRFWVGSVKHPHFIVVFKTGLLKLMEMPDDGAVSSEDILSEFSSNKMLLCPFISVTNSNAEDRLSIIRNRYELQSVATVI
jgi:hypothetical protein